MSPRGLSRFNFWLIAAVFGGAACYCLVGAILGHLYVPNRFHSYDAILSGPAAWSLLFGVLALWSSVLVRAQEIYVPTRRRVFWEFFLLALGLAFLVCSTRLPHIVATAKR